MTKDDKKNPAKDTKEEKLRKKIQILSLYAVFWIYDITLWANKDLWVKKNYAVVFNGISAFLFFVSTGYAIGQTFFCLTSDRKQPLCLRKNFFKFPTFTFIFCTLFPYGYTLNELYKASETASLPVDASYIQIQIVMPIIILSFFLWPAFDERFGAFDMLTLALELTNVFDIMELIPDIWYLQRYDTIAWLVLFFVSMAFSVLLIACPVNEIDDDVENKNVLQFAIVKTILTLFFTDFLFMMIRIKVMTTKGSAEYGFNMVVKNGTLFILHLYTIYRNWRRLRMKKHEKGWGLSPFFK